EPRPWPGRPAEAVRAPTRPEPMIPPGAGCPGPADLFYLREGRRLAGQVVFGGATDFFLLDAYSDFALNMISKTKYWILRTKNWACAYSIQMVSSSRPVDCHHEFR